MRTDRVPFAPLMASALASLAFSTLAFTAEVAGVHVAETPRAVKDFELVDQSGAPRKFSTFRGAPVLVFFGFTNCPDLCPAAMQRLRSLMQSKDAAVLRAQVVMISVDGARDTPAAMKEYLQPLSKKFIGLTGPPSTVRDIAAQFPAVFFKGAADKAGGYRVDHTTQIYLVDAAGNLRAAFSDAPLAEMSRVVAEISRTPAS
jgi:protein SCO1/2